MRVLKKYSIIVLFVLAACSSGAPPEPGMKLGKPYVVDGHLYYPEYDPTYDESGEASWYGPGFHGKYTASGEIFNQNDLTAAHPTLPMPCLVRVTNLQNGKSLIVRINDRGPFAGHRIIDLSKASAQKLGIKSIAQVRVQFLKPETEEYLASLGQGGKRVIDMAQYNRDAESVAPPSQIVENIDASSHVGQIVDDAAPVMTVSSTELETPVETPAVHEKPAHTGGGFIKAAYADDVVPQSERAQAPAVQAQEAAYVIQAGAFSTEENASKIASRLSGVASLTIDKADMGGKLLWRVRLGPFSDKASADDALDKVRAAGVADARVVRL